MKISIVTPHSVHNYGAVLQADALYSYLTSQGHEVYMQDFPPHVGGAPASVKEHIYVIMQGVGRFLYRKQLQEGSDNFEEYISRFRLTNSKDVPLYIVGSDQVWNPANIEGVFSLDFASEESKKISYAASMGVSKIPEHKEAIIRKAMDRLVHLSAREKATADEIERITNRKCSVELDPTLLMGKEYWKSQGKPIKVRRPYILMYMLHVPQNTKQVVDKVKKQYPGRDILFIDQNGCKGWAFPVVKSIRKAGPAEFLWLIEHADYVVTSSFHGTVFSIIFEKQFVSLINPSSPARISNLLSKAGLEMCGNIGTDRVVFDTIDYSIVRQRLQDEIAKSKEYLKRSIRDEG